MQRSETGSSKSWHEQHDYEVQELTRLWQLQQRFLEQDRAGPKTLHYLRKHLDFEPQIRRHLRAVDRMMPFVSGRVLEWGCRHAPDSAVLRMRLGSSVELHGVDIRDGRAFQPFHEFSGIEYRRLTDPVELPYPERTFDTVVAHGVLEHVPDPARSLDELARVLVPGGMLLIDALPNRWSYTEAWHRWMSGRGHERRFSRREARSLLVAHDFAPLAISRVEMAPMMLMTSGRRARAVYRAFARPIARISGLLERSPANVLATSLFIAAKKPVRGTDLEERAGTP